MMSSVGRSENPVVEEIPTMQVAGKTCGSWGDEDYCCCFTQKSPCLHQILTKESEQDHFLAKGLFCTYTSMHCNLLNISVFAPLSKSSTLRCSYGMMGKV